MWYNFGASRLIPVRRRCVCVWGGGGGVEWPFWWGGIFKTLIGFGRSFSDKETSPGGSF